MAASGVPESRASARAAEGRRVASAPAFAVSPARFRFTYRRSLDGLRGVAVLMVMAFHANVPAAYGGFLGVDVFFVLSGFLITVLLMQEWSGAGSINLGHFYARRALRLLPALVVLLLILVLLPGLFVPSGVALWKRAVVVLLYVANWASAFRPGILDILSPMWSLAIEEQFYFLWPPLLLLMLRLRLSRTWIVTVVLMGIWGAAITRVALWEPTRAGWARVYFGLDTRADSLLLGCLVGVLAAWGRLPSAGWPLTAVRGAAAPASLLLLLLFYGARDTASYLYHGGGMLACLAVAAVLVALVTSPPRFLSAVLEQQPLVWVGRISYGLYLWHFPVFHGLLGSQHTAAWGLGWWETTILRFATTFAVAALSFYLMEAPLLRLKRRFPPAAPDEPTASAPKPASIEPSILAAAAPTPPAK